MVYSVRPRRIATWRLFVRPKAAGTCELKTLLSNERAQIGNEDDRHLVHTDKRTGKQRISFQTWPDIASAKMAVARDLGEIEWEILD